VYRESVEGGPHFPAQEQRRWNRKPVFLVSWVTADILRPNSCVRLTCSSTAKRFQLSHPRCFNSKWKEIFIPDVYSTNKKLRYRRETARQLHMTTWAGHLTWWLHLAIQGRTRHDRRGCVILWHSNALIQKMLSENGFWHEIGNQGHSRSFISQSNKWWHPVV